MKELNEITRTRIRVLAIIVGVIVLIHLVVIVCVMRPGGSPGKPAPAPEKKPSAAPAAVPGSKTAAVSGGKTSVGTRMPGVYRKPLDVNWIGKPFNYLCAVRGKLPKMPGGSACGTGILVDLTTRNVLWAKDEKKSVPIASMAKMMTLLVAFDNLAQHPEWNLDMPVNISRATTRAAREGTIWLDVHETLPLRSLMQAVAIKSANDAAYQVAETTSGGDVEKFIAQMNACAAALRMEGTNFVNPHGLPNRDGRHSTSSAEGMVLLGERLLEYPDIMTWVGTQQMFIDRPLVKGGKTDLKNTNHLVVPRYPGVDGMKTGYTRAAQFCLTFTAIRNGRRLMGCVTGFPTAKERDIFARRMLDWGYLRTAEIDAGKRVPPRPADVSAPARDRKR